jgi:hypothetical protein
VAVVSAAERLLAIVLRRASALNERILALAEETNSGEWATEDLAWVRNALLADIKREALP